MIFSTKSLIASTIGAGVGLVIYYFMKSVFGMGKIGLIITAILAGIGYLITTLKMPDSNGLAITRKTGGEKLDDVILRALKFKHKGKRLYIYTKEECKK